jgi:ribonucleotide reductase beta subunit family protein with ferritin-like domain
MTSNLNIIEYYLEQPTSNPIDIPKPSTKQELCPDPELDSIVSAEQSIPFLKPTKLKTRQSRSNAVLDISPDIVPVEERAPVPTTAQVSSRLPKPPRPQLDRSLSQITDPKPDPVLDEPLLAPNINRFILFPITYPEMWKMNKQQEASFWTTEEIDMAADKEQWDNVLTDKERFTISRILAFFAASDGIVAENLAVAFMKEVQIPEARAFYGGQIHIEGIHAETYSMLIEAYYPRPQDSIRLFRAIETIPCVKRKAEWALNYIDLSKPFAIRLVAFAAVEGIFFSASFCAIFWLKKRGLLPGLTTSNELISRDESLHCSFACLLYSLIKHKPPKQVIVQLIKEAVECELEFVRDILKEDLLGLNSKLMSQYVRYVADYWMIRLGYDKIYGDENPFDWMTLITTERKTNFFERRVTDYRKGTTDLNKKTGASDRSFVTDADF